MTSSLHDIIYAIFCYFIFLLFSMFDCRYYNSSRQSGKYILMPKSATNTIQYKIPFFRLLSSQHHKNNTVLIFMPVQIDHRFLESVNTILKICSSNPFYQWPQDSWDWLGRLLKLWNIWVHLGFRVWVNNWISKLL